MATSIQIGLWMGSGDGEVETPEPERGNIIRGDQMLSSHACGRQTLLRFKSGANSTLAKFWIWLPAAVRARVGTRPLYLWEPTSNRPCPLSGLEVRFTPKPRRSVEKWISSENDPRRSFIKSCPSKSVEQVL